MATNASDAVNVATETSTLVHCLGANTSDIDCLKLCAEHAVYKHAVPQYEHGFVLPGFEKGLPSNVCVGGGGGVSWLPVFSFEENWPSPSLPHVSK